MGIWVHRTYYKWFAECYHQTYSFQNIKPINVGKAIGPDMIPNWVLKDFAPEHAPLKFMDIYNCSLSREGYVPDLLKWSIINPSVQGFSTSRNQSDLRPISLTCTLAKVTEGFARSGLIVQISEKLDPHQYAGHSTTDTLIYILLAIHEATDRGNCGARMFFANYSKGFDLIDHSILLMKLAFFDIDTVLINWIRAFLTGRSQAVKDWKLASLSDWKSPRGGIPQGTKLGVILFAVMTNNSLRDMVFED